MKKLLFLSAWFLLSCLFLSAQDAGQFNQEQTLTGLSLNIQLRLNEAKQKSENLSRQLTEARDDLTLSQEQRNRYQATSEKLLTSLDSTIEQCDSLSRNLNQSRQELALERERVRAKNKALLWFGIIGGVIILGKIAAFILYAKSVPIPRWLDIIL